MKVFMYIGDVVDMIPHHQVFPSRPGMIEQDVANEFYNYLIECKNKGKGCIWFIGCEITANILGHMVAKGYSIDPTIVVLKKDDTEIRAKFDEDGYIINWPLDIFGFSLDHNKNMFENGKKIE